jgi:hypothetical protein
VMCSVVSRLGKGEFSNQVAFIGVVVSTAVVFKHLVLRREVGKRSVHVRNQKEAD